MLRGVTSRPAPRDLDIRMEPHPAGLRVHVTGANTLANTIAYWTVVLREIRARPRSILLVDELAGPPLTPDDWHVLVGAMTGSELQSVRIAHVKPRGLDALEFCELHAKDAGFDARVFVREDEASQWLRYGESERMPPREDARRPVQYPPKLPATPGNTTGLSVPSFATDATPKK